MRPDLAFKAARLEMLRLMQKAPLIGWEERPAWVRSSYHPRFRGFLVISDDALFCLRNYGTRRE